MVHNLPSKEIYKLMMHVIPPFQILNALIFFIVCLSLWLSDRILGCYSKTKQLWTWINHKKLVFLLFSNLNLKILLPYALMQVMLTFVSFGPTISCLLDKLFTILEILVFFCYLMRYFWHCRLSSGGHIIAKSCLQKSKFLCLIWW